MIALIVSYPHIKSTPEQQFVIDSIQYIQVKLEAQISETKCYEKICFQIF